MCDFVFVVNRNVNLLVLCEYYLRMPSFITKNNWRIKTFEIRLGLFAARMIYSISRSNVNHFFYIFFRFVRILACNPHNQNQKYSLFSAIRIHYLRVSSGTTKIFLKNIKNIVSIQTNAVNMLRFMCKKQLLRCYHQNCINLYVHWS